MPHLEIILTIILYSDKLSDGALPGCTGDLGVRR
jgi:hypothetical protein